MKEIYISFTLYRGRIPPSRDEQERKLQLQKEKEEETKQRKQVPDPITLNCAHPAEITLSQIRSVILADLERKNDARLGGLELVFVDQALHLPVPIRYEMRTKMLRVAKGHPSRTRFILEVMVFVFFFFFFFFLFLFFFFSFSFFYFSL